LLRAPLNGARKRCRGWFDAVDYHAMQSASMDGFGLAITKMDVRTNWKESKSAPYEIEVNAVKISATPAR